ncbi:MAG: hypothetical protein NXH85_17750 [Pseudomonadaceae bacterium]|nr:hypothetical protein [Pseudomonadaceae bacterium]
MSGAQISGANGLALSPDGDLVVASVIGNEIRWISTRTGRTLRSEVVDGPDDVAYSPSGALYWTSILTGEVAGIDSDGNRVSAGNLGPGVNPLTFSDDGRLFVSQCFFGTNLYEVDPLGVESARVIRDDLGPGCGLNGMDWGPDGRLYGPRWFRGEVVSVDVETGELRVEAQGLGVPAAVKFDSNGVLHVLDTQRGQVLRRGEDGSLEVIVTLAMGLDNFVIADNGDLFVSSFTDGFVIRVSPSGVLKELLPGGLSHPGGIAIDSAGDLLVADVHALRGFAREDGEALFSQRNMLGVSAIGSMTNLSSVAEPGRTRVLLTSWIDNTVRLWDVDAKTEVAAYSNLPVPVAAVLYGGSPVAALHGEGSVRSLERSATDEAEEVEEVEEAGEGQVWIGDLPAPTGLAVFDGSLYVSDRELGQVLEIARAGERLALPEVIASGLDRPEGIAVRDGVLVVMEAGTGRLLRRDLSSQAEGDSPESWEELGRLPVGAERGSVEQPPSFIFNAVAVADDGAVYVSDEVNRALWVYR